jgi:hypothetical protein
MVSEEGMYERRCKEKGGRDCDGEWEGGEGRSQGKERERKRERE